VKEIIDKGYDQQFFVEFLYR